MIRLFFIIPLLFIATTLFAQINKNLVNPPKKTVPVEIAPNKKIVIKDINSIAKDLKEANTSADDAAVRLKSVNGATPQTCYSAMIATGYNDLATGKAVSKAYNMDLSQTLMDLPTKVTDLQMANILNSRLRTVKHTFPTLTFEQIIDVLRDLPIRNNVLFQELCRIFELNNQQIVQKGVFYFNNQFLESGTLTGFYPNPKDVYNFIMNNNSNINHYELFVMLINGGYSPDMVANQISVFFIEQNGRTSDNASSCIKNIMPIGENLSNWAKKKMLLVLNSDGSSLEPVQKNCYVGLFEILKDHRLSRTNAELLLQNYMECSPLNNPSCEAAKTRLINSILTEASYPEAKR